MANLKDIRRRISSVKGTQKITRAMKMVSAAKLRKAQTNAENFRAYSETASEILVRLSDDRGAVDHPLLARRKEKAVHILVISANRGLCGGFNSNLNRQVFTKIKNSDCPVSLSVVGKKARQFLEFRGVSILPSDDGVLDAPTLASAAKIAAELTEMYTSKEVDRVDIAYNKMFSVVNQKPVFRTILPVALPETEKLEAPGSMMSYESEPEMNELLSELLPLYLEAQIYSAILESRAAEQAARMTAMEAATSNAQEMIDGLTLEYNRARQSAITNELMDIVGGAEALSD